MQFPSPIGELHFSIKNPCSRDTENSCFRPLTGSYISQLKDADFETVTRVSVPYRGATFLNCTLKTFTYISRNFPVFPSPIGELHFSSICPLPQYWKPEGFRPLSGSYISQFCKTQITAQTAEIVSVPYRGATFLNTIPATPCPVWDE